MSVAIFDLYCHYKTIFAVSEKLDSARNALLKPELHTLSTHIYFSPFALSDRAPANYKFGTCADMFTVHRLYFIINGIARERRLAAHHDYVGFSRARARGRKRGIKLIFLLPSCLVMTRTIIGFNGWLV